MKRLTVVLAVALGLAVATVAGLWGSNSASAQSPEGLKCYRIQRPTSMNPNGQLIYISDQFEEKNLIIKNPISFCTLAEKIGFGGSPAGDQISNLVCYAYKEAPGQARFRPVEIETEDQFDTHDFTVTKPYSLCEPADKNVVTGAGGANGFLDDFAFKCYKVRRHEHGNRFAKVEVEVIDQFSGKDLRLGRPTIFCTQIFEKKNKAKNNHFENARVLEGPDDEHHASTISATRDRSDPSTDCAPSYGHSVWYTYTPQNPDDEVVDLDTIGSTYDTVLAVYRSLDENELEEVACNDDYNFPDSGDSQLEVKLEYGQKYFIMVGAFGGDDAGKLKLHLTFDGSCASCFPSGQAAGAVPGKSEPVGGAAGSSPLNLTCYSISQRAPEDALIQTADQLNAHQFTVGRGIMYCTPALKCIVRSDERAGIAGVDINYCSD